VKSVLDTRHWDLWLLRALWPAAELRDLDALLRQRQGWRKKFRELPGRLLAGDRNVTTPGRALLAGDPALRSGILLTLQMGPYPCVLEPLLAAGLNVTVVSSRQCAARWRPLALEIMRRRGCRGRLKWLIGSLESNADGRRLCEAVRDGGTVVVFADGVVPDAVPTAGNCDRGGAGRFISYRLPGREILVPTSLSRWLCRREVPVHPIALRWRADEAGIAWRRQATQRWSPRHDPEWVAQLIHDWVFHEVTAEPAQWSGWPMLVAAILAAAGRQHGLGHAGCEVVPRGLCEDFRRAFRLCLDRAATTVTVKLEAELAVWPYDVLADLTHDCFYKASGLRAKDLAVLRTGSHTLQELIRSHGRAWIEIYVLRLCLLGLARLETVGELGNPSRRYLDQCDTDG
jgi:hypothetical protein